MSAGRPLPGGLGLRGKAEEWVAMGGLGQSGLNDKAIEGVALLINESCLFSELHLNTPLQVAGRVMLNKVVTFCSFYLPLSDHVAETDIINLIEQLPSPFF